MTFRDTVALESLKLLLPTRGGSRMDDIATQCYNMADAMEQARSMDTPDAATQPHPDTARLDWLLAAPDNDAMWLAFNRCLALGMVGREAIDAAAKVHPL